MIAKLLLNNTKALRQFNNRPTHNNLNSYGIFRAKARRKIKESKKNLGNNMFLN